MKINIIVIVFGTGLIAIGIFDLFGTKIMDSGLTVLATFLGTQSIIVGSSRQFLNFDTSQS